MTGLAYRMRDNYNNNDNNRENTFYGVRSGDEMCHNKQKHVHELQGSVKIADDEPHNHRFCTVTEEAIPIGEDQHVHEVCFKTDFYEDHYHEFKGRTGPAVMVGDRHVHYLDSVTTENDGHRHAFEAATLINDPIKKEHKHECDGRHDHPWDRPRRDMNY